MIPDVDLLNEAIEVACRAHSLTVDKQGQPYILHPLRVMMQFEDEVERIVAVLHDVVEDSGWKLEDLSYIFPEPIIEALDALTHRDNESYEDYLLRVKANPLALRVKLADIKDNTSRLKALFEVDPKAAVRLDTKYTKARAFLQNGKG